MLIFFFQIHPTFHPIFAALQNFPSRANARAALSAEPALAMCVFFAPCMKCSPAPDTGISFFPMPQEHSSDGGCLSLL